MSRTQRLARAIALVLLALIWLTLFGIAGGLTGVIAGLAVAVIASALIVLSVGLLRWWRASRRGARALRGTVVTVVAGLGLYVLLHGGITAYRFVADHEPLPGDRYVVVIVADGASLLQAKELLMKGQPAKVSYDETINRNFPNISRTFLQQGAITNNGVAVWPSSSIPAHTAIMTGCYPRTTGVMGQRQFNTARRQYTSYIGLGILSHRHVLEEGVKTLNEYFPHTRSINVLQIANRGCSLYIPTPPHDELVMQRTVQTVEMTDALSRHSGRQEIPRLVVMTLPNIDHATHNAPLDDEKSMEIYLNTDRYVGEIFDLYQRKGIYDKTLFVLAADHGMGEVQNHVTLDNLMRDLRFDTYESFKWSVVPAWGSFEANLFVGGRGQFDRVYNALPLWGGNSDALLYIKGQRLNGTGKPENSWDIRATDAMLANYEVGGARINVIERLLTYSPGIGLICTNPEPGVFNIYGHHGQGQLCERQQEGQTEFQYSVVTGQDPLGYTDRTETQSAIAQGAWLTDAQWLNLSYSAHYPDALRRIASSFQHPNAATMHIIAADGWDFTPYYVAKHVLVGSHGSLNAAHSLVPIMFYGPGVKKVEMPYARTVDILPTILAYLGADYSNIDGRPLPIFAENRADADYFLHQEYTWNGARYRLEHPYASYDQRLVRYDTNGTRHILIDSVRTALPALQRQANLSLTLNGASTDGLMLSTHAIGQKLPGKPVKYDFTSGKLTVVK